MEHFWGFVFLAFFVGALWALVKSDYKQFSETEQGPDERDDMQDVDHWGV